MLKVDNGLSSLWEQLSSSSNNARKSAVKNEIPTNIEDALEKVQEVKQKTSETTFKTWDKHTDMVRKSQELRTTRMRQEAIERQNTERREEQTELVAQMAIENANRSQMIASETMARKSREMMAVA